MSHDDWPEDTEPVSYLTRDDPRCRDHPTELETNCRLCRSEAIADRSREPENIAAATYADRPRRQPPHLRLAPVIPLDTRRTP